MRKNTHKQQYTRTDSRHDKSSVTIAIPPPPPPPQSNITSSCKYWWCSFKTLLCCTRQPSGFRETSTVHTRAPLSGANCTPKLFMSCHFYHFQISCEFAFVTQPFDLYSFALLLLLLLLLLLVLAYKKGHRVIHLNLYYSSYKRHEARQHLLSLMAEASDAPDG